MCKYYIIYIRFYYLNTQNSFRSVFRQIFGALFNKMVSQTKLCIRFKVTCFGLSIYHHQAKKQSLKGRLKCNIHYIFMFYLGFHSFTICLFYNKTVKFYIYNFTIIHMCNFTNCKIKYIQLYNLNIFKAYIYISLK